MCKQLQTQNKMCTHSFVTQFDGFTKPLKWCDERLLRHKHRHRHRHKQSRLIAPFFASHAISTPFDQTKANQIVSLIRQLVPVSESVTAVHKFDESGRAVSEVLSPELPIGDSRQNRGIAQVADEPVRQQQ